MRFITIHWTAGAYSANAVDRRHYHFIVEGDGRVVSGLFKPEANRPPLRNGAYAAHCGGGNSHNIGVALAGMAGYRNPANPGRYPLTARQCEAAWEYVAYLAHRYGISVTPETVFTHYEFGRRTVNSDSFGKIDIIHLPYEPSLKAHEVGGYIRNKVEWYRRKLTV
jgi:hypothetical protein